MIIFPNAKINLGLNIVSRREDGYHNIETVFYPVNLKDALEVVPAGKKKGIFRQSGLAVGGNPEDNLVMKAFRLVREQFALPETDIYLRKNIPYGAGLGGGSADAAFMIRLLNEYAALSLTDEQMEVIAGKIGMDCPFFIRNKPVFASERGNVFSPVSVSLKEYQLLIIKPPIHISTAEAYAGVQPCKPEISIRETIQQPVENWKDSLKNDFEKNIFLKYPEINRIKNQLYELGAAYASMSGSGSVVYGIFRKDIRPDPQFPQCEEFRVDCEI